MGLKVVINITIIFLLSISSMLYYITFIVLSPMLNYLFSTYNLLTDICLKWIVNLVSILFQFNKVEAVEFGEDISKFESSNCLLTVNHQSDLDIPVLLHMLNCHGRILKNSGWIVDSKMKLTPFGGIPYIRKDIFCQKGDILDKQQLEDLPSLLDTCFSDCKRKWLVMFPEGDYKNRRFRDSIREANMKNVKPFKYVSNPKWRLIEKILRHMNKSKNVKSKGMSCSSADISTLPMKSKPFSKLCTVKNLSKLHYLIDITISYESPHNPLSIVTAFSGQSTGSRIELFYRVYDMQRIPQWSSYQVEQWMWCLYRHKDVTLAHQYELIPTDNEAVSKENGNEDKDVADPFLHDRFVRSSSCDKKVLHKDGDCLVFSVVAIALWTGLMCVYLPNWVFTTFRAWRGLPMI